MSNKDKMDELEKSLIESFSKLNKVLANNIKIMKQFSIMVAYTIQIKNETKHVAHTSEWDRKEYYLLPLFHEMLSCPIDSTKDMVADIATILMDETYSISYLKYTN